MVTALLISELPFQSEVGEPDLPDDLDDLWLLPREKNFTWGAQTQNLIHPGWILNSGPNKAPALQEHM